MSNNVLRETLGSDRSMIEGAGIEGGSTIVSVQDSHRSPICSKQLDRTTQQEPPQDGPVCQTVEAMRDACGRATAAEVRPMPDGVPGWTARPDVLETRGVARTVRERREGIPGYLDGRLTNAYLEGANSLTRPVKRVVRGFRNVEYLATAIFPGLGGLSFGALACAPS